MTTKFEMPPDRVVFEKDGSTIFDTTKYPVSFYPTSEQIEITGKTIEFPDLVKGDAYAFARGLIGSDVYTGCHSYVTIAPQEWGPIDAEALPVTNELADEVIGYVPAGTDLAFIQVKLTRTSTPSQIKGETIPVLVQEGEYVNYPGGCMPIEFLWPVTRMIEIRLGETDEEYGTTEVILRRRQSVPLKYYSFWRAGNDADNTGWTYGGAAGEYGHPVYSMEERGPSFDPLGSTNKRTSGTRCNLLSDSDPTDFGSTYTADILITPGRTGIDADGGAFEGAVTALFLGSDNDDENYTTSKTFSDKFIGPAAENRKIVVIAHFATNKQSTQRDISDMEIDGESMTQVAYEDRDYDDGTVSENWSSVCTGIYIKDWPDGTTADFRIDNSGTGRHYGIEVFAVYGLESSTPDDTEDETDFSSTVTLSNVDGGFALAGATTFTGLGDEDAALVTGMDTTGFVFDQSTSPSPTVRTSFGYGFHSTDGTNLTVGVDFAAATFVAASFH